MASLPPLLNWWNTSKKSDTLPLKCTILQTEKSLDFSHSLLNLHTKLSDLARFISSRNWKKSQTSKALSFVACPLGPFSVRERMTTGLTQFGTNFLVK